MSLQLFLELMAAKSNAAVGAVLDQFALENQREDRFDLPYRYLGDKENNRGPVQAMESTENALYEKIMNGFDAVIEYKQRTGGFKTDPANAAEALAEIGQNLDEPGIYLITSRADTRTGGTGQPKKRSNVVVVDEGIGITSTAFDKTIMSLEGSNKLTNPLMAGSYGFGGAAIYRDSEFSILWSRSAFDASVIGYTVVFQRFNKNALYPSYIYLVGDDNRVLNFQTAQLPSEMVIQPSRITNKNVMEASSLIPIPDHGTGVKVFELENFAAAPRIYAFLRDRGFGMPVPCRFRNGVEKGHDAGVDDEGVDVQHDDDVDAPDERGTTKRLYNAVGLRFSLNNPAARKAYPAVFHQTPILIMELNGKAQATLECWVLERAVTKSTKTTTSEPVLESLLGKERRNTPLYVTLNGMAQENISTQVILRNVNLPYLRNHLVLEVNCDQMTPQVKGRFFTSNRERLTKESQEWVRREVAKFLAMQAEPDGDLYKLNAKYRDAVVSGESLGIQEAGKRGMEFMARLMKSGVIGSILTRFGATTSDGNVDHDPARARANEGAGVGSDSGRGNMRRSVSGTGDSGLGSGGRPDALILKAIPDLLEVRKHTFKQGASEWVVVRVNAFDDWDDFVGVEFPDFLSVVSRVPLRNGRVSYYVKCSEDTELGTIGVITVLLNRNRVRRQVLTAATSVTVIRGNAGLERPLKPKTTLPRINLQAVEPGGAGWEHINDEGLQPGFVAFDVIQEVDTVSVYWNKAFPAFVSAVDEIMRRYRSAAIVEKFKVDYQTHISVFTLAILEGQLSSDGPYELDAKSSHRARAEAVTANAMMLTMMTAKHDDGNVELAA